MSLTHARPEQQATSRAVLVALLRRNAALIQGVFAVLWSIRLALLSGPWELPVVVAAVAFVVTRRAFRSTAPFRARDEFRTPPGRRFLRPVTIMTLIQIAASVVLPAFGKVRGRDDLSLAIVAVTIGVFLMFFAVPLQLTVVRWIGLAYTIAVVGLALFTHGHTLNAWVSTTSAAALLACTLCCAAAAGTSLSRASNPTIC